MYIYLSDSLDNNNVTPKCTTTGRIE